MEDHTSEYTKIHQKSSNLLKLLPSIASLLCASAGVFCIGYQSNYPFQINAITTFFFLIIGLLISLVKLTIFILKHKKFPSFIDSPLILSLHPFKAIPGLSLLLLSGFLMQIGGLTCALAWYYDPKCKGVTQAIIAGSTCISVFINYLLFREKVHKWEVVGIVISLIGLIMISVADGIEGTLMGFVMASITLISLTFRNILTRKMQISRLDAGTVCILNDCMFFLGGLIVFLFRAALGIEFFDEEIEWVYILVGGCTVAVGYNFTLFGLMMASTAPSLAIVNSNAVLVMALDIIFRGLFPGVVKMAGSGIILLGVIITVVIQANK